MTTTLLEPNWRVAIGEDIRVAFPSIAWAREVVPRSNVVAIATVLAGPRRDSRARFNIGFAFYEGMK